MSFTAQRMLADFGLITRTTVQVVFARIFRYTPRREPKAKFSYCSSTITLAFRQEINSYTPSGVGPRPKLHATPLTSRQYVQNTLRREPEAKFTQRLLTTTLTFRQEINSYVPSGVSPRR